MTDIVDVSIRIGNSFNWENITPGKTYYFRVNKDVKISELKSLFYECFNENKKNDIMRYQIYTKNIILLHDNNIISDVIKDDDEGILFYAILI